jgi:hypothetical protein
MTKQKMLRILNPILVLLILAQIGSGLFPNIVPYFAHQAGGIFLGVVIGVHLVLNWSWVRNSYFKR